jgi:hypothetical protein
MRRLIEGPAAAAELQLTRHLRRNPSAWDLSASLPRDAPAGGLGCSAADDHVAVTDETPALGTNAGVHPDHPGTRSCPRHAGHKANAPATARLGPEALIRSTERLQHPDPLLACCLSGIRLARAVETGRHECGREGDHEDHPPGHEPDLPRASLTLGLTRRVRGASGSSSGRDSPGGGGGGGPSGPSSGRSAGEAGGRSGGARGSSPGRVSPGGGPVAELGVDDDCMYRMLPRLVSRSRTAGASKPVIAASIARPIRPRHPENTDSVLRVLRTGPGR